MNVTSRPYPRGVDEMKAAGLEQRLDAAKKVARLGGAPCGDAPRVSPIQLAANGLQFAGSANTVSWPPNDV